MAASTATSLDVPTDKPGQLPSAECPEVEPENETESEDLSFAEQVDATADAWTRHLGWDDLDTDADMGIMSQIRMIGGAVIGIAVIVVVVNAVLTTQAVNNTTGPFSGVVDSLGTTGVSAMSLLVIALLVAAARVIMNIFGGCF